MADFTGRKALITGAGKRLGRECALALTGAGADVVLHYNRSEKDAQEVAQTVRSMGREAFLVQADLSEPAEAQRLAAKAHNQCGKFDILVNNASIFPPSTIDNLDYDELIRNINVNAWAPFVIARGMRELSGGGHIINFLDCRIASYDWNHVGYHASKVLLELFTREMAIKFAPEFAVNAIAPGLILPPEGKDESYLESLIHTVPLERYGSARDVSDALLFLAGSTFITGQIIYLDGGRHLNGKYTG